MVVTAKVGQSLKTEKVTIVCMDKKDRVWVKYHIPGMNKKLLYLWNSPSGKVKHLKRLGVGSGFDPIYIY